jgi:hypothetical protein
MKTICGLILSLHICAGCVCALELPQPPFGRAIEARLMEHHTIHITVGGSVTGQFDRAIGILQSTNVLDLVQDAYAALLPDDEKPEFTVQSTTNGHYYYVNKSRERSDIYEIRRSVGAHAKLFEGVMYVQGERAFGMFESLITMRVMPGEGADASLLTYHADVHVYPHCMALRIFLRYFPGVRRYFRSKTAEMQGIITGVFNHMIAEPGVLQPAVTVEGAQARDRECASRGAQKQTS